MKHQLRSALLRVAVAPRVGAWIETRKHPSRISANESPPAWGRGLKHCFHGETAWMFCRPPRGGVD